jgi:DNA-binding response OmpR family regulator
MMTEGRRKRPCVVVVEDHEDSCHALVRLLAREGYSVVPAHSLQQAREAVERYGCDLLISDIGLPDGSGLDLMRELRKRHGVHKAIAMTGFTDADDERACAEAGFSAFVAKPVEFRSLQTVVGQLLADDGSGNREVRPL